MLAALAAAVMINGQVQSINLTLTAPELNEIGEALLNRPMRSAEPVLNDIRAQVREAIQPPPQPSDKHAPSKK